VPEVVASVSPVKHRQSAVFTGNQRASFARMANGEMCLPVLSRQMHLSRNSRKLVIIAANGIDLRYVFANVSAII
jgi:hypothetical protein